VFGPSCSLGFGRTVVITWVVGIYVSFPPVRFLLTGSDGTLATSKTAPAEKSGLSAGPENGELSKEELIRRKREEFIQKHGKGLDKSRSALLPCLW
jgi:hypothetical protein